MQRAERLRARPPRRPGSVVFKYLDYRWFDDNEYDFGRELQRFTSVAASIVVGLSSARAEPVGPLVRPAEGDRAAGSERAVYASFGLDGALAATLPAATGLVAAGERVVLDGWADVTWAAGDVDAKDMRYRVGARVDALRAGRFRLCVALAPALRTTSNLGFRATALSTELRLSPGFHDARWSAELDLGLEQAWLTYIAPTDE